jgi:hypothetical protein
MFHVVYLFSCLDLEFFNAVTNTLFLFLDSKKLLVTDLNWNTYVSQEVTLFCRA